VYVYNKLVNNHLTTFNKRLLLYQCLVTGDHMVVAINSSITAASELYEECSVCRQINQVNGIAPHSI